VAVAVIGISNWDVSTSFFQEIAAKERENPSFHCKVVALADTESMLLTHSTPFKIPPSSQEMKDLLKEKTPISYEEITRHMSTHGGLCKVVIDCCEAHKASPKYYSSWITHGFHVLTANLSTFAGDLDLLESIKKLSFLPSSDLFQL